MICWDSRAIFYNLFDFAAKQATSPADLMGKLVEFGISTTDTRGFAEEIFSRVPRKSSGLNVSFDPRHNEYNAIFIVYIQQILSYRSSYYLLVIDLFVFYISNIKNKREKLRCWRESRGPTQF